MDTSIASMIVAIVLIALGEPDYPARLRMIDDAPPLLGVRGKTSVLSSNMGKPSATSSRVAAWVKDNFADAEAVRRVFALALSREPTPEETKHFAAILKEAADAKSPRSEALEDLFWAVLTGREFLFNH